MYELKDYQSILKDKAEKTRIFFEKYPDESTIIAKNFFDIYNSKIRSTEPEIMVYGIYNAGKSSILNELMGEDRAKVEDKPTTDTVTHYDWQGYKIADTPGVGAPIEHEDVTQEHLKKADIVLFVMSTTGSNEKAENYQRMKAIADAGKKIIIILNDKNADMGKNDEAIQIIKRQVAVNMKRVGIENVDDKYCIVTVNAKRAKKGRTENKPNLYNKSGINELKNVIINELKKTTSFEILRSGIKQMENNLEQFIQKISEKESSILFKNMDRVLDTFKKQKISIRRQINTYIETQAEMLGDNLPQIIWANRNKQDQLEDIVKQEIVRLNEKVQREINRQLTDAVSILEMELKSFSTIEINDHSAEAESFKNILSKLSEVNTKNIQTSTDISTNTNDLLKMQALSSTAVGVAGAAGIASGILTESATAIATNLAKTEIGKALAKTTVGKLVGSAIPIIGPIIAVGGALSLLGSLLGGNDDQKQIEAKVQQQNEQERRRVEAEMQARQELKQKCHYLAENIANDLKTASDNGIIEILKKYEEPFKAELEKLKSEDNKIGNDIKDLRELFNEYDLLAVELGSR